MTKSNDKMQEEVDYPCHPCVQMTSTSTDFMATILWKANTEMICNFFKSVADKIGSANEPFSMAASSTTITLDDGSKEKVYDMCFHGVGLWMTHKDALEAMRHLKRCTAEARQFDVIDSEDGNCKGKSSTKVRVPRFRYLPLSTGDTGECKNKAIPSIDISRTPRSDTNFCFQSFINSGVTIRYHSY
jgi:hypothetical protein